MPTTDDTSFGRVRFVDELNGWSWDRVHQVFGPTRSPAHATGSGRNLAEPKVPPKVGTPPALRYVIIWHGRIDRPRRNGLAVLPRGASVNGQRCGQWCQARPASSSTPQWGTASRRLPHAARHRGKIAPSPTQAT